MTYNHLAYMEAVATSLKEIHHSTAHKAFVTASGMGLIEGLMEGMNSIHAPFLIAIDDFSSRLEDRNSDNVVETPVFQFCICYSASTSDSVAQREAIRKGKVLAKKVLSKLKHSKELKSDGLNYLDIGSILIEGVGPVASNYYGVAVSFAIAQAAGITYNESDWL